MHTDETSYLEESIWSNAAAMSHSEREATLGTFSEEGVYSVRVPNAPSHMAATSTPMHGRLAATAMVLPSCMVMTCFTGIQ